MEEQTNCIPRLATAREVSASTGLGLQHIYKLTRQDEIPHVRIGPRAVRFSIPAIQEWISRGGTPDASDAA
jgi:excisionase family DNA binding protein